MIRELELSFITPLHHDQHLPDQPGSSAGASASQQATLGPHPGSSSITGPQQVSPQILCRLDAPANTPVYRGICVSLSQWQHGK